ncbi:hypothetical protein UYSO10_2414 [Kosakonia radicincitans]|nr:hypothetical protein UYSO10_2414 [Kosakonia radicincitans]
MHFIRKIQRQSLRGALFSLIASDKITAELLNIVYTKPFFSYA